MPEDFETLIENGGGIAGSPATVRDRIRSMTEEAGTNYFIGQFSFGELAHDEVMHSASLFAREVLPMAEERMAQAAGS
jgi:alkanesulfonate monooxygenase SsuD/methylene tetrahydromethanopterin reductase-like flavin-dependent oxidoreductase (luciferase family)